MNNEPIHYRLYGVIQHIGSGLNFGHYVCAMRGFKGQRWYHFDDQEVIFYCINIKLKDEILENREK